MKFRELAGLAALLTVTVAVSAQPRQDLKLTASLANSTSRGIVHITARARNAGSDTLHLAAGIDFRVAYRPSAWSESMMVVRRDSVLQARGEPPGRSSIRCGELPTPPFPEVFSQVGAWSPLALAPGESLTDSFSFACSRADYRAWPGRLVVQCTVMIDTGRTAKRYAREQTDVSIPVP